MGPQVVGPAVHPQTSDMTTTLPRRILAILCAVLLSLLALTATGRAGAATDTTRPTVTVPAISSFIVGEQTDDTIIDDGGQPWFADGGANRRFTWTMTDASGICRYTLDEHFSAEGWTLTAENHQTHVTSAQFTYFADSYENSDDLDQVRINVFDCAGNKTSVVRPTSHIDVEKDYGPTIPSGWARTSCTCAIGDSMLRTSTANASLSTVVNGQGTNKHVALVMAKGPGRGKAAIYVDNVKVTTIDTYASVNTNRVIMWDRGLTGSANHTIKVVNLATSGRPRIDIDAYVH